MSVNNSPPILIHPTQDKAQMASYINENFRKIADGLNPFQMSDGANNIINIGKDSVGNYTLKVSQPGFNAFDAADSNLIFNSSQNIFKIVDKVTRVTATYSISGTASEWKSFNVMSPDVYQHNLGYIPVVIAFIEVSAGQRVLMPYTFSSTPTTSQFVTTQVSVNATDTYLYFTDLTRVYGAYSATGGGHNVTCFLMQETAN